MSSSGEGVRAGNNVCDSRPSASADKDADDGIARGVSTSGRKGTNSILGKDELELASLCPLVGAGLESSDNALALSCTNRKELSCEGAPTVAG